MKTPNQIGKRIAELKKEKGKVLDARIRDTSGKMIELYDAEIIRYNFMINELEWVLKK